MKNLYPPRQLEIATILKQSMASGDVPLSELAPIFNEILNYSWSKQKQQLIFQSLLLNTNGHYEDKKAYFDQFNQKWSFQPSFFQDVFLSLTAQQDWKKTKDSLRLLIDYGLNESHNPEQHNYRHLVTMLGLSPQSAPLLSQYSKDLLLQSKGSLLWEFMNGVLNSKFLWPSKTYQNHLRDMPKLFNFPPKDIWLMQKYVHKHVVQVFFTRHPLSLPKGGEEILGVLVEIQLLNPRALIRTAKAEGFQKLPSYVQGLSSVAQRNQLQEATPELSLISSSRPRL